MHAKNKKPELLAPAGGMEQMQTAIRFGADAVYLATDRFGMRQRATNFALEDLEGAVRCAHEAGVSIYVACNILMEADDIAQLPAYFEALDAVGVDAFIVGDLGAASLARKHAPRVALHVSTQASVANVEAARVWHSLGARRIVCAREMSLADIARLRAEAPDDLEIEVFVHGAMCMAVSGRCLISSYLTGRSGSKGHCTQPCRWNYTLEEEKRPGQHFPIEESDRGTLIMNAKDLNMLMHLDEIMRAGVDSIKIEGRNKKAFYVATVVNAYRQVLDGTPPSEVRAELDTISHRPYGTGFYFSEAEQEPLYDGYEQSCIHVADVISCTPYMPYTSRSRSGDALTPDEEGPAFRADEPHASTPPTQWLLEVRCRNRFAEGEELEALVPRAAIKCVTVLNLTWLPHVDDEEVATPQFVPVAVANRSCNRYRFMVDTPLVPGSFLRSRTFRRSSRSSKE